MNLLNKKILVTGASGFIGSHLTEMLVLEGSKVRAFVHYNSRNDWGNLEFLSKNISDEIEIIAGDIQDPFSVKKAIKDCQVVFHLASLIAIPYSYQAPQSYAQTNILGAINVMQASLEENVEKVVHTSTSECYGTAQYVPIDEHHPFQGQSPYSATKIGADMIAESYYRSFGVPVSIIRPFNTYGPRQSARAVIPTIIIQALSGNNIKLGDLEPTRDFNYVSDTVDGFIKVAVSEKTSGEVINIGSGKEISIGNLAKKIFELLNCNVSIISDSDRVRPENSEVERLLCDNRKAKNLIGWESTTSLDKGLRLTIEWIKENQHKYKPKLYNL